jgi:hypothetical protein
MRGAAVAAGATCLFGAFAFAVALWVQASGFAVVTSKGEIDSNSSFNGIERVAPGDSPISHSSGNRSKAFSECLKGANTPAQIQACTKYLEDSR